MLMYRSGSRVPSEGIQFLPVEKRVKRAEKRNELFRMLDRRFHAYSILLSDVVFQKSLLPHHQTRPGDVAVESWSVVVLQQRHRLVAGAVGEAEGAGGGVLEVGSRLNQALAVGFYQVGAAEDGVQWWGEAGADRVEHVHDARVGAAHQHH